MRTRNFLRIGDPEVFGIFRSLYNEQLKIQSSCEVAFQHAIKSFFIRYGYYPYDNLEHYLLELFRSENGFQFFE